jgi:hypothetical protein
MTTTQTRTAAAAITTLIILGLLIATPAGAFVVHNFLAPVWEAWSFAFSWLFSDTLDAVGRTFSGLFGEFDEMWSSIVG